MKILCIIDNLRSGGKERQLVEFTKGITLEKDIELFLVLLSYDVHYKEILNLNLDVRYVKRKYKKDILIFLTLFKLFRDIKPDIVHSWGSMPSIYSLPAARILGIKFINGMIRNTRVRNKFDKNYIRSRITFPYSDVIVSNSKAGLKAYNAKSQKSICIHNGFDFKRLEYIQDENTIRKKYNIKKKYIVGMVASFSDYKDYATYISAAEIIALKREDVVFLAIGDGKNIASYKENVNINRDQLILLGRQTNIESLVNIFNVGVLLTNTKLHEEGISNSIIEYMALGKPVIATKCGGNEEIVENGVNGFIIPPFDHLKLVENLEFLIDNQSKSEEMGRSGKKKVELFFSQKKMVNSYIELYKKVLSGEFKK